MARASEREWTDGRRVEESNKTSSARIGSSESGETSIAGARDSKKAEAISFFSAGQAAEDLEQSGGQAG